jgi:glycosyltransferase involved in cell wall biosynthesis
MNPLVSVIIPTFNRFPFLQQAVASVLKQSIADRVEIIIINDASTDAGYKTALDKIYGGEKRVVLIHLEKNMREVHGKKHAQGETRNVGLKIARGEWIAFLDDDDFFYDRFKLAKQIESMRKNPGHLLCSTNAVTGHGLIGSGTYKTIYFRTPPGELLSEGVFSLDKNSVSKTNWIMNSSVLMHRSLYEKVGLQKIVQYEDWEYWLRCLEHTRCCYIHEPMIGYDMGHGFGKQYE